MVARAAANTNGPPHREKVLPSERNDLSARPGISSSGGRSYNPGGPVRILSKNGVLTELGRKVEKERLAKLAAATATDENGGEREAVTGSAEESSS